MSRDARAGRFVAVWLLRLALSGVFIYAGAVKIRDAHAFSESIDSFRLLPPVLINAGALTLPPLEILAGVLALLGGRWRRVGAFSLLATLMIFLAALASAQARGLHVDCGCFGPDRLDVLAPTRNLWIALARDAALAGTAWFLYLVARRPHPAP